MLLKFATNSDINNHFHYSNLYNRYNKYVYIHTKNPGSCQFAWPCSESLVIMLIKLKYGNTSAVKCLIKDYDDDNDKSYKRHKLPVVRRNSINNISAKSN